MDNGAITPFQLHRNLEKAMESAEERRSIFISTLSSQNFSVIRRIPEVLLPLSDEEKEMIICWAEEMAQGQNVSNRDFAFHMMVNCKIPAERIVVILEKNKTFSRGALDHIQQMFRDNGQIGWLDGYLTETAEILLAKRKKSLRDKGRHILMTLARTEEYWLCLARRFSTEPNIFDLRQKVISRFLEECPDGVALTLFAKNIVNMCSSCIFDATKKDVYKETPHMHWILMCFKRMESAREFFQAASLFKDKFGNTLPRSLKWKIEDSLSSAHLKKRLSLTTGEKYSKETNADIAGGLELPKAMRRK